MMSTKMLAESYRRWRIAKLMPMAASDISSAIYHDTLILTGMAAMARQINFVNRRASAYNY